MGQVNFILGQAKTDIWWSSRQLKLATTNHCNFVLVLNGLVNAAIAVSCHSSKATVWQNSTLIFIDSNLTTTTRGVCDSSRPHARMINRCHNTTVIGLVWINCYNTRINIHKINIWCSPESRTCFLSKFLPIKARGWMSSSTGHVLIFVIFSACICNISASHKSDLVTGKNISAYTKQKHHGSLEVVDRSRDRPG